MHQLICAGRLAYLEIRDFGEFTELLVTNPFIKQVLKYTDMQRVFRMNEGYVHE